MTQTPLAGIKVLDLTQIYQGPYATFLMAQAGAEVIKIEPPGGERLRPPAHARGSMAFAMLNANKLSITLNLKAEAARGLFLELVADADLVVENFGPGAMERLGLGWETLKTVNPRLIYVSGTGFGLSGPDHDLLAMDHTVQAAVGLLAATGGPDDPPTRAGGAPSDIMGGVHMYAGAMTALLGRHQTGEGTRVEVSMMDAMYFNLSTELSTLYATGKPPPKNRNRSPSTVVPYSIYRCSDGRYVAVICIQERHWHALAKLMGHPALVDDPRFSRKERFANEAELNRIVGEWMLGLPQEEAFALLREAKIPAAPVRRVQDVYGNAHMLARGSLIAANHPGMGEVYLPTSPLRFSNFNAAQYAFYPELGSANQMVLGERLGRDDETLAQLAEAGAI